jgi:hypothetical protein
MKKPEDLEQSGKLTSEEVKLQAESEMKKPEDPEQSGKLTSEEVKLQAESEMKKPEDIEQHIKQHLDASVDALPESVTKKLAAARQKALLAAAHSSENSSANSALNSNVTGIHKRAQAKQATQWNKPLWAVAASLCVMVPLWYANQGITPSNSVAELVALDSPLSAQSTTLSALDIMSTLAELDDEEMELLDNLEFALWLSKQEQTSAHG